MKLSKYLADYIEHEIDNGYRTLKSDGLVDVDLIQQGIEAFESTEAVKVLVVNKEQRDKQVKEFIEGWRHFCDKIDFGHSFLDAKAIRWMNEVGLKIGEMIR